MKIKKFIFYLLIVFCIKNNTYIYSQNNQQYKDIILYRNFNELISNIEQYVDLKIKYDKQQDNKKQRITLITLNNINLGNNKQYQKIHNILNEKYYPNTIIDIYITKSGKVIIPEIKKSFNGDDYSQYKQEDKDFKTKLETYGLKNISIINKQQNFKLSQKYYKIIIYSISKIYYKYFYLSDKYINCSKNTLFSNLSINNIITQVNNDTVGEFRGIDKLIVIIPDLFNREYNIQNLRLIEYVISHEMGHAIELNLCRKIFKDLNLKSISQQGLEILADVCFVSGESDISNQIMNQVLSKMHAPKDLKKRQDFIQQNLTAYANSNPSEFFADAVAYGSWQDETQNKPISALVDQEIKSIIEGKGEIYKKLKITAKKFIDNNIYNK